MVNTEKDIIDIQAGGEVIPELDSTAPDLDSTALDPATITPAKKGGGGGPVALEESQEQEEEHTLRTTVPTPGGVEATINGTGKQQEKEAAGADSAEARRLIFQKKKMIPSVQRSLLQVEWKRRLTARGKNSKRKAW